MSSGKTSVAVLMVVFLMNYMIYPMLYPTDFLLFLAGGYIIYPTLYPTDFLLFLAGG